MTAICPTRGVMDFKPKPNYRIHYQITIPIAGSEPPVETEDIYTPFGDSDAIERAKNYIEEEEKLVFGLIKFKLLGLERIIYEDRKIKRTEKVPINTEE